MNNDFRLYRLVDRESNARTYSRNIDKVLSKGKLSYVYDNENKEYIDCLACAGALPLGHNHPFVKQKVIEFLESGQLQQALDIATPAKINFAEQLYQILPQSFAHQAKIQFCGPTGADAIEAALKLFKTATGRRSIIVFQGAYHGMTHGALSLMGNLTPKRSVTGLSAEIQFLPYPYTFRSPFGANTSVSETERLSLVSLENLLSDPESGITKPAMVLVEVIQGEGGCIPASANWLHQIREITARHDVPLVIDEVQTGIGRTGDMFAYEFADITPDAIILSKAIGGGYPLAVLLYRDIYDQWLPGAHAGTFRGNQIALVSGAATLDFIQRENLLDQINYTGNLLKNRLLELQDDYPAIGDVRGRGLMLGLELIDLNSPPDALGHPLANGKLAQMVKKCCFDAGLIIESGGRQSAVLRMLPPLIITPQDVNNIVERLRTAFSIACSNYNYQPS